MAELMVSGLELIFEGMGIVFLFLAMLVSAINLMSAFILRYFPEAPSTSTSIPIVHVTTDKSHIAAITAAIHQYRVTH